jgi:hypothetical protein
MTAMYAKIVTPGMWSPQGLNGSMGGLELAPNKVRVAGSDRRYGKGDAITVGVGDLNTALTKSGDT